MTKDDVKNILYDRYIKPTESKEGSYIGVEIEMPVVNLLHRAVNFDIVHKLTELFLKEFDFIPMGIDEQGHIYSALNKVNGDVFSYDCSYNNMEFSFGKESELHTIHGRFRRYYDFVQDYFKGFNYTLTPFQNMPVCLCIFTGIPSSVCFRALHRFSLMLRRKKCRR